MPTFDSDLIRNGSMKPLPLRLPEGFGIGALRHNLADGITHHWDEVIPGAVSAVIKNHPSSFLGPAADTYALLDANCEWPMPPFVRNLVNLAASAPSATFDVVEDRAAEAYRTLLIECAAEYISGVMLTRGMTPYAETKEWKIIR